MVKLHVPEIGKVDGYVFNESHLSEIYHGVAIGSTVPSSWLPPMLLERRESNCVPAVQVDLPALKVPETSTETSMCDP